MFPGAPPMVLAPAAQVSVSACHAPLGGPRAAPVTGQVAWSPVLSQMRHPVRPLGCAWHITPPRSPRHGRPRVTVLCLLEFAPSLETKRGFQLQGGRAWRPDFSPPHLLPGVGGTECGLGCRPALRVT